MIDDRTEFVEAIRQEKIRKDYKDKLRNVLDNFGKTIIKEKNPYPNLNTNSVRHF